MTTSYLDYLKNDPIEYQRFLTLRRTLENLKTFLAGRSVFDFGASYGLSACAYVEIGASRVVGVEPDPLRVSRGNQIIQELGLSDKITLSQTTSTDRLQFQDDSFDTVFANAVLEHIPEPRARFVRECGGFSSLAGILLSMKHRTSTCLSITIPPAGFGLFPGFRRMWRVVMPFGGIGLVRIKTGIIQDGGVSGFMRLRGPLGLAIGLSQKYLIGATEC